MSVEVRDLRFSYGRREVLKGVSFSAEYGEFLSILGPNGVGKSTLFRCMLGTLSPAGGGTWVDGRPVAGMKPAELARKIAYIPQSHNPVFHFTVLEMVLMGTAAQLGRFSVPGPKQRRLAEEALERLGIAGLRDRSYGGISGGERQLTLIARAIAQQANILLMDEPSASLDFGNRIRIMDAARQLAGEGCCIIQSTHDPDQAYRCSDKVLALHNGSVLAFGSPKETVCREVISALYGMEIEVYSLRGDTLRVCIPGEKEAFR